MKRSEQIGKYFECSCCGKYKEEYWMAYIKPDLEIDTFFDIDNMCSNCIYIELDRLTNMMMIPNHNKKNVVWLKNNVFKVCPNDTRVEMVLFLCGIILDYR
jgi:hypothetical protein